MLTQIQAAISAVTEYDYAGAFTTAKTNLQTAFKGIFGEDYFVNTVKSGKWQNCQVVVSTVQTLLAGDRYRDLFSQIDFELVISDENRTFRHSLFPTV
jgi:hypothetical protein